MTEPTKTNGTTPAGDTSRSTILLVTSSLLVDRIFKYSAVVNRLAETHNVVIWAASARSSDVSWNTAARVEPLPPILPFREFPYNMLRRVNEFAWDFRHRIPSRMSMLRHVRNKRLPLSIRAMKLPARIVAWTRSENLFESSLERLLLGFPRSPEAENRLRELAPEAVVITGPFQFEQPAIFAAAKRLGIPVLAYIPSWDNVSTKNRMVFQYDGYMVWSEHARNELRDIYPAARNRPIYVVGAAQFDVFLSEKFMQSREDFCRGQGLDPELPIILYTLGSPNFLQEHHGALELARRVADGALGRVQMLVRPHPIHDRAEMHDMFSGFGPMIKVQRPADTAKSLVERSQDDEQVAEWINTFRHADVVVNLSSTVTVDASIFDTPVVNLDFDPRPERADQALVKDINHRWNHFKPVAESGGVWLVDNFDELVHAVRSYLRSPALHRAQRRWIVDYVCGWIDGKCGKRMGDAIRDFAGRTAKNGSADFAPQTTTVPAEAR